MVSMEEREKFEAFLESRGSAGTYRQLRQDARLTQQEVADRAGVSRVTYGMFESNRKVSPETRDKIRAALVDAVEEAESLGRVEEEAARRIWEERKGLILDIVHRLDGLVERGDLDGLEAATLLNGHLKSLGDER